MAVRANMRMYGMTEAAAYGRYYAYRRPKSGEK